MLLKLSRSEIRACMMLYKLNRRVAAAELADALKVKESFLSRVLKKLFEKDLITYEKKGTRRYIGYSEKAHSQKLKEIYYSRPDSKIEDWLSGYSIDALAIISDGVEYDILWQETLCSRRRLYSILNMLYSAGIAGKSKSIVSISDPLVLSFANEYAIAMQNIILRKTGYDGICQRVRKHVLLQSKNKAGLTETGLTLLSKNGLEANLINCYYYFNLDEKPRRIDLDEAFVHAVVFSKNHGQDKLLLAGYYLKNQAKLNIVEMKRYARIFNVERELEDTLKITGNYERLGRV